MAEVEVAGPTLTAAASAGPPARPMDEVLAHRRWVRRERPFPYIVARDVFTPDVYAGLDGEFRRIQREHPEVFQRNMPGYDATGAMLDGYRNGPLGLFVSRPWHDLLAGLFDVPATGDMTASMHHHAPGGASGWPHNDLNPGWFGEPAAGPDAVRVPGDGQVQYHHGTRPDGVAARETVRGVSALFYLANPDWEPGDGGETGLYPHLGAPPSAAVPPVNNSLVAFECTPTSWHGFLANVSKPRNCVVMWIHRPKADVEQRWGAQSIAYW